MNTDNFSVFDRPCRKRKLACDHALPTCSRCVRRKIPSSCVYNGADKQTVRPNNEVSQTILGSGTPPNPQAPAPNTESITLEVSETASPPDPLFGGSSGFLGPTSFSAVFLENSSGLLTPNSGSIVVPPRSKEISVDGESVRLGASILEEVPDQTTCTILFTRYKHARTAMGDLGLEHCVTSLWGTFGQQLSSNTRRASNLESVSRLITQNSATPLETGEDFKDWLDAITGPRIRWEAMGILFTAWAYGSLSSPDDDEIFAKQKASRGDRMKFAVEMQKLGLACANLSGRSRFVNVLSVFLSYQCCILETVINGDSSKWSGCEG